MAQVGAFDQLQSRRTPRRPWCPPRRPRPRWGARAWPSPGPRDQARALGLGRDAIADGTQHLHGDLTLEIRIVGAVDHAHPTAAEHSVDVVAAERVSWPPRRPALGQRANARVLGLVVLGRAVGQSRRLNPVVVHPPVDLAPVSPIVACHGLDHPVVLLEGGDGASSLLGSRGALWTRRLWNRHPRAVLRFRVAACRRPSRAGRWAGIGPSSASGAMAWTTRSRPRRFSSPGATHDQLRRVGGQPDLRGWPLATLRPCRGQHVDPTDQIGASPPQRRHPDLVHREAGIEVPAELARVDLVGEVAVGRGDDAHVDLGLLGAAHRHDLAGLQRPQQLGLQLEGKLAHLVEKERASVGGSEQTRGVPWWRRWKAPFSWPKSWLSTTLADSSAQLKLTIGPSRPDRAVQLRGAQLLAGAGLADDEGRGGVGRHPGEVGPELEDSGPSLRRSRRARPPSRSRARRCTTRTRRARPPSRTDRAVRQRHRGFAELGAVEPGAVAAAEVADRPRAHRGRVLHFEVGSRHGAVGHTNAAVLAGSTTEHARRLRAQLQSRADLGRVHDPGSDPTLRGCAPPALRGGGSA